MQAAGVLLHPAVSTVSYLTTGGAPTLVLDARATSGGGGGSSGGQVGRRGAQIVIGAKRRPLVAGGGEEGGRGGRKHGAAVVSYPREGKLLAFSGALLQCGSSAPALHPSQPPLSPHSGVSSLPLSYPPSPPRSLPH